MAYQKASLFESECRLPLLNNVGKFMRQKSSPRSRDRRILAISKNNVSASRESPCLHGRRCTRRK
jgi:hypothetical protein